MSNQVDIIACAIAAICVISAIIGFGLEHYLWLKELDQRDRKSREEYMQMLRNWWAIEEKARKRKYGPQD